MTGRARPLYDFIKMMYYGSYPKIDEEEFMHISDPNLHLKLQEMCDCYLETDYLAQMDHFRTKPGPDPDDEAMRYLALALMHTITEQAGKLSLKQEEGEIKVMVKKNGSQEELPPPPAVLFTKIIKMIRAILHFEGEKGESELSLGLRNGSLEMLVKLKAKGDETALKFEMGGS